MQVNPYDYTRGERYLAGLLSVLSFVAIAATVFTLFSINSSFFNGTLIAPEVVAAFGLFFLLTWVASADVRRFRPIVHLLSAGFIFGGVAFGALGISPFGQSATGTLLIGAAVCVAIALLLIVFSAAARVSADAPVWRAWMTDKPITRRERILQVGGTLIGAATLGIAVAQLVFAFTAIPTGLEAFFDQPVWVAVSSIGFAWSGAALLLASNTYRRHADLLTLVIGGELIALLATLFALIGNNPPGTSTLVLIHLITALLLFLMKRVIDLALLDQLTFFTIFQFRALESVCETMIGGGRLEKVHPYQIALRTDSYLGSFRSSRLFLARLSITGINISPLLWFKPPLGYLNPNLRHEFIDRQFKRDILTPRGLFWIFSAIGPKIVIDLLEAAIRFNIQLSHLGYYTDPVIHKEIGYVPFSRREKDFAVVPTRSSPNLDVMTPTVLAQRGIDVIPNADAVVIGTGAAGSIIAEQLVRQGREVLMLEKGQYVNPDNFSEDEVEMIGRLYGDGALQLSQSLRFTILQGSAVGGTTVVNNAVCFDTPDRVLNLWNDTKGVNAGIDVADYRAAQKAVRERMKIRAIRHSSRTRAWSAVLNPGDALIEQGVRAFLKGKEYNYDVVEANIDDCLGCGYCNIGCRYGRKLSMLDTVLPEAQYLHGADRFRIVSEAQVVKLNGSNGTVTEIEAVVAGKRRLIVRNPKTVVVSAGPIASPWLLLQSGIGAGELPVGRWLCFNMGSPLHGWFGKKLDCYAGLQIAHYIELFDEPKVTPPFVYETWYNPPVAQALSMPGWLDTHYANMTRYSEMSAVGVLVGTEPNPNAHLTRALFLRGAPDVVYDPTPRDLDVLVNALVTLGRIMLAGGAKQVFASTRKYQSYSPLPKARKGGNAMALFESEDDLQNLHTLVKTERDILIGTGHPQGGNRISKNRGRNGIEGGVIDPDFKVYGMKNLYVCDASVHPTATTVNPQLTVMTLAHYASQRINSR